MPDKKRDHKNLGVYMHSTLIGNFAGWVNVITFFFDGVPYDYTFPVGRGRDTARDAADEAHRQDCRGAARHDFLEDVELNMGVPH